MEVLRQRSGTQFDPSIVAALERSLVRHVWEPARVEPTRSSASRSAFDHDDPAASDLMAGLVTVLAPPVAIPAPVEIIPTPVDIDPTPVDIDPTLVDTVPTPVENSR
jgi:hypothetical protein